MGESVRPVRRYFSKEAKSKLVREARALEDNEGMIGTCGSNFYGCTENIDYSSDFAPKHRRVWLFYLAITGLGKCPLPRLVYRLWDRVRGWDLAPYMRVIADGVTLVTGRFCALEEELGN